MCGSVQTGLFAGDADHCFVDRNQNQITVVIGL